MAKKSRFSDALAVAVASGLSIREGARVAGCSESVAYHLSSTIQFKQLVASIRSEALSSVVGQLNQAASKAVQALVDALGGASKPSERIAAAKAILASLGPLSELAELRARLDALEQSASKLRVVS